MKLLISILVILIILSTVNSYAEDSEIFYADELPNQAYVTDNLCVGLQQQIAELKELILKISPVVAEGIESDKYDLILSDPGVGTVTNDIGL